MAQTKEQTQTQRMQNLKTRADKEINERLTALNSLTSKVSLLKKLSAAQKAAFAADIQSNITSLTALKLAIDADTEPATMQSNVRSIVDDYRIFALYVPKIHLLAGADAATDMVTNLTNLANKLQVKITADQQAGKDVTILQTRLTDMQAKITDAGTQAQDVTTTVIPLSPSGYPGNSNNLKAAHEMLKTAKNDIQTARQDAQKIIQGLKAL